MSHLDRFPPCNVLVADQPEPGLTSTPVSTTQIYKPNSRPPLGKTHTPQASFPNADGTLDGTPDAIRGLLRDLAEFADQADTAGGMPVLKLDLGGIATTTSLTSKGSATFLSITASLPQRSEMNYLPPRQAATPAGQSEMLWHGDEGRYVMLRSIPISLLPDEPSAMAAIMETADHASAWHASICEKC